jgi:Fe-S cluster biogenesis protein NfuA
MQQQRQEHERRAARIEALLQEVAAFPDLEARAATEELVQTILDMYGGGLARILELVAQAEGPDHALTQALARDDLVGALFLLHGLHPLDLKTRLLQALDALQPSLQSRGSTAELIGIENGVARLRLAGSCQGCSAAALKAELEEALYQAVPDLDGLQIEGGAEAPRPITFIPRRRHDAQTRSIEPGARR